MWIEKWNDAAPVRGVRTLAQYRALCASSIAQVVMTWRSWLPTKGWSQAQKSCMTSHGLFERDFD